MKILFENETIDDILPHPIKMTTSSSVSLLILLVSVFSTFILYCSTNELHQQLSLLKVVDIHTVNVLSFVNECRSGRCPTLFSSYYHVREAGYEVIQNGRLHVPMARTDTGQSSCKIKGARLWNDKFNLVNPHLYKKNFKKTITKHFIETYH